MFLLLFASNYYTIFQPSVSMPILHKYSAGFEVRLGGARLKTAMRLFMAVLILLKVLFDDSDKLVIGGSFLDVVPFPVDYQEIVSASPFQDRLLLAVD